MAELEESFKDRLRLLKKLIVGTSAQELRG